MSERSTWRTTTHVWAHDVDPTHLSQMREVFVSPGACGGLRHLVLEVVAYAQDEAAATGRRGSVVVTHHADGSVSVDDDGRGTDTRVDAEGRVVRKPVMATADVRFTDPETAPRLPDGLPRRGMSSVAAVSAVLVHTNHRESGSWAQTYRYGIPDSDLVPVPTRGWCGTVVTIHADVEGPAVLAPRDLAAFPDLDVTVRDAHSGSGTLEA